MKMSKNLLRAGFCILVLVAFAFVVSTASAEDPAGKKVFEDQKCSMCHSVEAAGIAKKPTAKAPDLSKVGASHDAEWITKFLKKEVDLNGKKHMKGVTGTDDDLKALVDWLASMKGETK